MKKNELVQKWSPVLENEELPEIVGASKQQIIAKILENQHNESLTDSSYRDEKLIEAFGGMMVTEAEVAGDSGYTAMNIAAGQTSGAVTNIGPAVLGMVRRVMPSLMAFDICGVQPLNQPTGQVFAMRSMYGKDPLTSDREAFHPMFAPNAYHSSLATKGATTASDGTPFAKLTAGTEIGIGDIVYHWFADTGMAYLQNVTGSALTPSSSANDEAKLDAEVVSLLEAGKLAEIAQGMATSIAELREGFNGTSGNPWHEMSFRIDKQTVEAKSRQLKAEYTIELAQDLRAVHGMDADAELQGILANEVMLEINREVVDWINYTAQVGKSGWTQTAGTAAGVFDFQDPLDVRGARWAGESYKALLIQITKESNEIARQTGRGAGNFVIASRNVVSALGMIETGITVAVQGFQQGLNTDTSKGVFAGVLSNGMKVYIDQYARSDYFVVGYKGDNQMDAGIFYHPYIALTPFRAVHPNSFQPVIGFKTRYAIGINPFADSALQKPGARINSGMPSVDSVGKNAYFRRVFVKGL